MLCKLCDNCSLKITIKRRNQRFCSKKCKIEFHKNDKLKKLKKLAERSPMQYRNCHYCDKYFIPSRRCNFGQRFCSGKCKSDNHAYEQRLIREKTRKQTNKKCKVCDVSFCPKRSLKEIYCSKKCRLSLGKRIYKMMRSCYKLTNMKKINKSHNVLGYSPKQLLDHLQSFPQWDRLKHEQWHLDHIFPIITFLKKGITDIKIICCLNNLQPLSRKVNCSKGGSYKEKEFEKWLTLQSQN